MYPSRTGFVHIDFSSFFGDDATSFALIMFPPTRMGMNPSIKTYKLVSSDGRVQASVVPELGGIVSSLVVPAKGGLPRECLYRGSEFWNLDTDQVRGGIPPLFPICGRLLKDGEPGRYDVDGQSYRLPIHGFAMRRPWTVVDANRPNELRLRLASSTLTRQAYPFHFELELIFRVSPAGLSCVLIVANVGDVPMPYYAGFHPYFATPLPGAEKEQTLFDVGATARHFYNETKTDIVGSGAPPPFPRSIAGDDINGLLLDVDARGSSQLTFPDGFILRQTASPLFRHRQFYTLPNQPFFCDEPWMAPPGAMNRPNSPRLLPPSESDTMSIAIGSA